MPTVESDSLKKFHQFVTQQLESAATVQMSPEEALALWREQDETLNAIREGLADVDCGRTQSLEDFDRVFRARHGMEGPA